MYVCVQFSETAALVSFVPMLNAFCCRLLALIFIIYQHLLLLKGVLDESLLPEQKLSCSFLSILKQKEKSNNKKMLHFHCKDI